MPTPETAYLGPPGTFSHQVALRRYGEGHACAPMASIDDVCAFAAAAPSRRGVVPVENSSGGPIAETVDILISGCYGLRIEESLSLSVRLALLGRRGAPVRKVYSHGTPLCHCARWLRREHPDAARVVVASTAQAAEMAAREEGAAAVASPAASALYGLDVLAFPIEEGVPNVTQFYALRLAPERPPGTSALPVRTTLALRLADRPGSLYDFLEPFKRSGVNLSRILSRPVFGRPSEYSFFIDLDGDMEADGPMRAAVEAARRACSELSVLGSYPVGAPFEL